MILLLLKMLPNYVISITVQIWCAMFGVLINVLKSCKIRLNISQIFRLRTILEVI